jgi:hypothetical protein
MWSTFTHPIAVLNTSDRFEHAVIVVALFFLVAYICIPDHRPRLSIRGLFCLILCASVAICFLVNRSAGLVFAGLIISHYAHHRYLKGTYYAMYLRERNRRLAYIDYTQSYQARKNG